MGLGPPVTVALYLLAFRDPPWPTWLVLGVAVGVVAVLELIASLTRSKGSRQRELAPLADAGVALARWVSVAVALLQSMIAMAIGLQRPQELPLMVGAGLVTLLVATGAGVRRLSQALHAVRAAGHGDLVKGYGPLAYSNKDDPRIWVPKLGGVGSTLNFAHPVSWLILAAFLTPLWVVLALALSGALGRR